MSYLVKWRERLEHLEVENSLTGHKVQRGWDLVKAAEFKSSFYYFERLQVVPQWQLAM